MTAYMRWFAGQVDPMQGAMQLSAYLNLGNGISLNGFMHEWMNETCSGVAGRMITTPHPRA